MHELMRRYRDTPMDLADASIVSAAERLGTRRVFTLDRHLHVHRIDDRHAFEVV
jgi:predicted nucleic acid-binding protein